MSAVQPLRPPLLADVRQLIDAARQRVTQAVNAELTQLYWQIGRRISTPHADQRTAFPSLRAKRGNPCPHSHGRLGTSPDRLAGKKR